MQIPPALRHRQFATFWLGMIFSWTATQVLIWAIPWHIRTFTDSFFYYLCLLGVGFGLPAVGRREG